MSAASRADYAETAAVVLSTPGHEGRTFELGGDAPFTLAEPAAEASRRSGKTITYNNLPEGEYEGVLKQMGLPGAIAHLLADSDAKASQGELDSDSKELSQLIGHPTTGLAAAVASALSR